jgi:signal transduction histidine kinase
MKKNINILFLLVLTAAFSIDAARSNWNGSKKNKLTNQSADEESIDAIAQENDAATIQASEPSMINEEDEQVEPSHSPQNTQDKRAKVIKLVDQAIGYIKNHSIADSMRKFTHTKEFIDGELYLFVYDEKGVCFATGQQSDELWREEMGLTDVYGTMIVQEILNKGKKGGGWITYNWRNATKVSYVKQIKKDNKTYTVGSGYYPHSKEDEVVNLVKGAVALFNKMKADGQPREEAFSSLSYPIGRFVAGDLYLYALDFQGSIFAQGDRPGLIGTNSFDYKDAHGKYVNQEIINKLKANPGEGVWVEYSSKRAPKRAYAEQVTDNKGINYFIACGYYPNEDREMVIDLVKKGYQYMKAHGRSIASKDFSDRQNDTYRLGDLYLVVYDLKGKCIADGGNAENVGTNQWGAMNDDGRYYVREIIKQGQEGGGWVDFKVRNSFESFYVEMIDIGIDKFVIGCGIFPSSKDETVSLMVKSASSYFLSNTNEKAFNGFSHKENTVNYIRGDLSVFVIDMDGLCYVSGDDYNLIWQNILGAKDDDGKPYIKQFINTVRNGPGTVSYKMNKAIKTAHIDRIEKDGVQYVIGSSYYR